MVVVLIAGLLTVADSVRNEPREVVGDPASPAGSPTHTGAPAPAAAALSPAALSPAALSPAAPSGAPGVLARPGPVSVPTSGFVAWALLDRRTNTVSGSPNLGETSDTASMIKAWIAADFLRRTTERGGRPGPARLHQLSVMIRDSDNAAAEAIHRLNGGGASIGRLTRICGLTETSPYGNWWSNTTMSARDTVRMGACLADGRAAGPAWTGWLLDEMRRVRGVGDFGPRAALPAGQSARVAIKNGWLLRTEDQLYRVNCLAIGDGWVLGVLNRYPGRLGFEHGTATCRSVGEQVLTR